MQETGTKMIIMVVSSPLLAGLDDAGIRPAELEDLALTGPPLAYDRLTAH